MRAGSMTDYRAVVRHVRYWRGQPHKWSTSYSFTGSGTAPNTAAATLLANADSAMCYAPATADAGGGMYGCDIYLASGGTPVASYQKFDPDVIGDWLDDSSTAWTSRTAAREAAAEVALLVTFAGGLGRTGKPVTFRKWFHSVPTSAGTGAGADISPSVVTALAAAALTLRTCLVPTYGLVMGNSGRLGTDIAVSPYYSNHQMPKGRLHKVGSSGSASSYRGKTVVEPLPVQED